jgi:hypothetical protein
MTAAGFAAPVDRFASLLRSVIAARSGFAANCAGFAAGFGSPG